MRRRLQQAILLHNTVRHLKPIQIGGRIWFRLSRPKPDLAPAPARRTLAGTWVAPSRRKASLIGPDRFRFLNRDGDLSGGWDDQRFEKLWRYNLHYFDDLAAESASNRAAWHEALIQRWISANPPASGTGWEPYPVSLRIVNWIKWALEGNALSMQALHSLAVQARWLSRRLEFHLLGNHLFANAKALLFAGSFFEGDEAGGWYRSGAGIVEKQLPEQVLADGAHFELSTMYHALALEDVLDLVNLARAFPPSFERSQCLVDTLAVQVGGMRSWLTAMCHPDGKISFFNDAAMGIAPSPEELHAYADRLGFDAPSTPTGLLGPSGYVRLQTGPAVAIFDAARIGPDYLPGHAHADTLSFELSVQGRRLLVNSGTSLYGAGEERLRQRGTAAHNTVVVAGENSSEVWSGFRVARRAEPFGFAFANKGGALRASCSHAGYRRLSGRPIHRRTLELRNEGLDVVDQVDGGSATAQARFHFHPDWTVSADADGRTGTAAAPDGQVVGWRVATGQGGLEPSSFHPEFGLAIPSTCLAVALSEGRSRVEFRWQS